MKGRKGKNLGKKKGGAILVRKKVRKRDVEDEMNLGKEGEGQIKKRKNMGERRR